MSIIDIKLTQNSNGVFDISIADDQIETEDGFDTALKVSLLSDARAPSSKVPKPEYRRGWMGNTINNDGSELGSLLWLIEQKRLTQQTLNEAIDYARKSWLWLIEDGVAARLNVSGSIVPTFGVNIQANVTALDGVTQTRYFNTWGLTGV